MVIVIVIVMILTQTSKHCLSTTLACCCSASNICSPYGTLVEYDHLIRCTGTPTWCRLTYRVRWGDGYGSGKPGKRPQHV
ncbi:hypothetical protein Bca101_075713 [Brassica carinata]